MGDLFWELRRDHERVTACLEALQGDPAGERPPPAQAGKLARHLVAAESAHEVLEELYLWPSFKARVDDPEMPLVGLAQEQTAKKLLQELAKTSADSEEFRTLVDQVASDLRQHIAFEEGQAWPRLALVLGAEASRALGAEVAQARRLAPTRPHPLTPPDPRILRTVGPVVGTLDRFRDLLPTRG